MASNIESFNSSWMYQGVCSMRAKIRAAACLSREAEGFVLELHPPHSNHPRSPGPGQQRERHCSKRSTAPPEAAEADLKYKSIAAFLSSTTL
jgi:hypothetical protein